MNKLAILTFIMFIANVLCSAELVSNGRSNYVIVIPSRPTPVEQTAGRELQDYLERISGVKLPILEGDAKDAPALWVGATSKAALLPGGKALQADEIVIKNVGDDLVLTGGKPHGPLYAVDEFLRRLGVRWWTSRDTFVPKKKLLSIPKLNIRHVPSFRIRESFYYDVIKHPEFASHLRCNGHFEKLGPELGGHNEIIGFCHTFERFLPRAKYIAEHPDWYEMRKGKRDPNPKLYGQLCTTNPEVKAALTQKVLERLRKASNPRVVSVTQNDNRRYCQCPRCEAAIAREGSPAGPLLEIVNYVADAIKKEFPGVKVETLAYQYTRKAPEHIRPSDNVVIRLCSIECDFSKPLSSEANASFRNDVTTWSKVAPELAIWNYVTDFRNYFMPHPNLRSLADDIRFFKKHHVVAIFEQGDYQSGDEVGDFVAMRAWVLAQLMWDDSQDLNALIDEFLKGYYGAAAPSLRKYLDLLEDEVAKANIHLGCFEKNTTKWLTIPTIVKAKKFLQEAETAVANDPVLSARVKVVTLPLTMAIILRYKEVAAEVKLPPRKTMVESFIATARAHGVKQWREGRSFDDLEKRLRKQ